MNTQSNDLDIKTIREAVEDYYGGWYEANPEQINHSIHLGKEHQAVKLDETGKEYSPRPDQGDDGERNQKRRRHGRGG